MPATRRSTRSSLPARRKRAWARSDEVYSSLAAGTQQRTDLCADFSARWGTVAVPPGTTVGGVLLDFNFVNNAARSAATDGVHCGIYVSSETDSTEVEDPFVNPDADWMWRAWVPALAAAGETSFSTARDLGGPLRIRSKRRMDEIGMRLWLVFAPIGSTTYSGRLAASTLLILS